MCTITYLPLSKDSFILTSNRDESKVRPTHPPAIEMLKGQRLLYPKDALAGGTWVCVSEHYRVACLMNGAFEKHPWNPPYRKSRGLVMLDMFTYQRVDDFVNEFDFAGIEPFTIIVSDNMDLMEFRWDGQQRHFRRLDASQQQIWSSASLYPKVIRDKRERWFRQWLAGREKFRQEDILEFHRFGGEGDLENDFVMNRYDIVQTVSITSIVRKANEAEMYYHDLVEDRITETSITFTPQQKVISQ